MFIANSIPITRSNSNCQSMSRSITNPSNQSSTNPYGQVCQSNNQPPMQRQSSPKAAIQPFVPTLTYMLKPDYPAATGWRVVR